MLEILTKKGLQMLISMLGFVIGLLFTHFIAFMIGNSLGHKEGLQTGYIRGRSISGVKVER